MHLATRAFELGPQCTYRYTTIGIYSKHILNVVKDLPVELRPLALDYPAYLADRFRTKALEMHNDDEMV